MRRRIGLLMVCLGALGVAFTPSALGSFPGTNGKLAFTSDRDGTHDVWVMNPGGTAQTKIQSDAADDSHTPAPAWAPDGVDIAFMHERRVPNHQGNIFVMDRTGGNLRQVTTEFEYHGSPAWSPDGSRIAFDNGTSIFLTGFPPDGQRVQLAVRVGNQFDASPEWTPTGEDVVFSRIQIENYPFGPVYANIAKADARGGGVAQLLTPGESADDGDPSVSPGGGTVVFTSNRAGIERQDLYTVPIGGGTPTLLTDTPSFDEEEPVWSPDGTRIAFAGKPDGGNYDVYTIAADGSGLQQLTTSAADDREPSWQRTPPGYVRPKGATSALIALAPAYKSCDSANRGHAPPLSHQSCAPPVQASQFLTVGTPDANGAAAQSVGSVRLRAYSCPQCLGPGPNADVFFDVSVTDVRKRADMTDHNGELETKLAWRITDRDNIAGGGLGGTVVDLPLPFAVPCSTTTDTAIGATCSIATSINSLVPNAVTAGQRAIWQPTQVELYDGGSDGDADTQFGNTLFLDGSVFVP